MIRLKYPGATEQSSSFPKQFNSGCACGLFSYIELTSHYVKFFLLKAILETLPKF